MCRDCLYLKNPHVYIELKHCTFVFRLLSALLIVILTHLSFYLGNFTIASLSNFFSTVVVGQFDIFCSSKFSAFLLTHF